MKSKDYKFRSGELYIFSHNERWSKTDPLLWGMFDKRSQDGHIYLEAATSDFLDYTLWTQLPQEYVFCRLATRSELRDFVFNMSVWQTL